MISISLVLATISRTDEVIRLLESLIRQTYKDFELIVIDQNSDNRVMDILDKYTDKLCIRHLRSEAGLSLARNVGIEHARGLIIGFPDDDCWYPEDLLRNVMLLFQEDPGRQALTGWYVDPNSGSNNSVILRLKPGRVSLNTPMKWGSAINLFVRRELISVIGLFNLNLGPGSHTEFSSGEDTDYVLRILRSGMYIYFDSFAIRVFHVYRSNISIAGIERARKYNLCIGHLLRLHRLSWWIVARFFVRPLGGFVKSCCQVDPLSRTFYWTVLYSRIKGYTFKPNNALRDTV
jgi:glycosyltransferase involved in cell wall biosynthesis